MGDIGKNDANLVGTQQDPCTAAWNSLMTTKALFTHPRSQAALLLGPALMIYVVFAIWPMIDGQFSRDDGQLNSVIVMTVLPATLVYLIFQCYFVSGLTSGAVKG
jgi:ABC-type glycerol-3-phosphate transport system permease component